MAAIERRQRETEELSLAQQTIGPIQDLIRPLYRIVTISQRIGQGFRARRFIPKGALILEDDALFSVSSLRDPLNPGNIRDISQKAARYPGFSRLSCPPGPQTPERRFSANSFGLRTRRHVTDQGIFMEASRFNHSCVPNAYFDYNEKLECLTVYAIYDMEAGHEIFINYRQEDSYQRQFVRNQALLQDYGFTCQCQACRTQTSAHNASEINRPRMQALHTAIQARFGQNAWAARRQQLEDVVELRNLLNHEGIIYPKLAEVYQWEAECYENELKRTQTQAVVNLDNFHAQALVAARRKLELDLRCTGRDSEQVKGTLAWLVRLGGR